MIRVDDTNENRNQIQRTPEDTNYIPNHNIPVENTEYLDIPSHRVNDTDDDISSRISNASKSESSFNIIQNVKIVVDKWKRFVIDKGTHKSYTFHGIDIPEEIAIKSSKIKLTDTLLGDGNFGTVIKGVYDNNRCLIEVAVKKLHGHMDSVTAKRFVKEAIMMYKCEHKNVLKLIGVCFDNDVLIVTPIMSKGDLLSYIKRPSNHIENLQLIRFSIDIAKGMEYISSIGLIHCDLAVRNCLLNDELEVKISDFGLTLNTYNKHKSICVNGMALPIYNLAIEVLEELKCTKYSDVWSFGIVLWELITRGAVPYKTPPVVIDHHNLLKHFLLSGNRLQKPDDCPLIIYELMLKCWDRDPNSRPDFGTLVKQLKDILDKMISFRDTGNFTPTVVDLEMSGWKTFIYAEC